MPSLAKQRLRLSWLEEAWRPTDCVAIILGHDPSTADTTKDGRPVGFRRKRLFVWWQDTFQKVVGKGNPIQWCQPVTAVVQSGDYVEYLLLGCAQNAHCELVQTVKGLRLLTNIPGYPAPGLRLRACELCRDEEFGIQGWSGDGRADVNKMKTALQKCPCVRFLEERLGAAAPRKPKKAKVDADKAEKPAGGVLSKIRAGGAATTMDEYHSSSDGEMSTSAKKTKTNQYKKRSYANGMSEVFWEKLLSVLKPPAVVSLVATSSLGPGLMGGLLRYNENAAWGPALLALPVPCPVIRLASPCLSQGGPARGRR